jgi:hypothetical protein
MASGVNLEDYDEKVALFLKGLEDQTVAVSKAIGTTLRTEIATRTPVLSGRAAAGWNLSVGEENTHDYGEGYHNPSTCVNDGEVNVEAMRFGDELYITNAVPYIADLEYGTGWAGFSPKAPQGMVAVSVADIEAELPSIVASVQEGNSDVL